MPNLGARILYVDDDVALCRLAQRRLTRLGFDVTLAYNGADALNHARAQAFDLVALDHFMPGQDGIDTLAQLMALPVTPAVVYVTGSDETRIAVHALKAGAADYVVKSASDDFFELLGSTINQALDARRVLREKERAEQALRESNAQLEAMLGEMNHRVANSLQMVVALVNLQARRAIGSEAKAMMDDIRQRIGAVARVHRQLYVGGGGTVIAMADYIAGLAQDLTHSFSTATAPRLIKVMADPVELPSSTAISLGILVNELVSNSCKYAYHETDSGEVRITFTDLGDNGFRLAVEDNGRGLDQAAPQKGSGFGSQIISAMVDSLGATLRQIDAGPGLCTVIERRPD